MVVGQNFNILCLFFTSVFSLFFKFSKNTVIPAILKN